MRLLPLSLLLAGCAVRHPYGLYAETRPLPADAQVSREYVAVTSCTPYLFGLVPLAPNYGFPELVDEARGSADALVDIAVDATSVWWLIGTTSCHSLRARRVAFPSTLVPPEPLVVEPLGGNVDESRNEETAEFKVDAGLAANAVVTLLYADAGWRRDGTQWKTDAAAVERRIAAGYSQAETLQQLREARKAHPEATVAQLVEGLAP